MLGIFRNKIFIIVLVGAIIILLLGSGIPNLTHYTSQWELRAEIVGAQYKTIYLDPSDSPSDWEFSFSGSEGTGGKSHEDQILDIYGPSVWRFDPDGWGYPNSGLPDIEIMISDVREKTGHWPYQDLTQEFDEGYKYVVSYKEYLFDLQVRTIADVNQYLGGGLNVYKWESETACPYEWHANTQTGTSDIPRIGKPFEGAVYARFVVQPWGLPDFGDPEGYVFSTYWAGVMNTKVEKNIQDKVRTGGAHIDAENHHGYVRGLPSEGAGLNMFMDDGTLTSAYNEVPWDLTKVLDPDIKTSVIIQLPFEILAGAWESFDSWAGLGMGQLVDLKPVDYYFTTTIRIESFIVKEYTARDPQGPVDPSPIKPPEDYYPVQIPSFLESYWIWIVIAIIAIFIILIVFAGPVLVSILALFMRSTRINYGRGEAVT